MKYISTRGKSKDLKFEDVLLTGLAPDGGLFVPNEWPSLNYKEIKDNDYYKIAAEILFPFLNDFIDLDELIILTKNAYRSFEIKEMAPLIHLEDNRYILELFHQSFHEDSFLPHLAHSYYREPQFFSCWHQPLLIFPKLL